MLKLIKNNYFILILLILSGLILWPVFVPGYFFHHDDLQVIRIVQMQKCFLDLQVPCRWVPDMGYGNGFPLFNYYSVLPYYIGGLLSFIFGYVVSAKILFLLPLLFGGIFMYLFVKELYGKEAGFLAGLLYQFAPYRAVDAYVRGAIAESFALAVIPLVFLFGYRLIQEPKRKNIVGFSLSLGAFLTCHNIMTMYFVPLVIIWLGFWLVWSRSKKYLEVIISFGLGVGLSGFFLIPAYLEKGLVQTENLLSGGLNYTGHFVAVYQMFTDRKWGYGGSVFGNGDGMSFQIGWPHWWLVLLGVIILLINAIPFIRHKWIKMSYRELLLLGGFLLMFLGSIYLMHNKSVWIWESLPMLQYSQFPWRMLSVVIFSVSVIAGIIVFVLPERIKYLLLICVSLLTIWFNWYLFKPADFYIWVDDKAKLSGEEWRYQQGGSIMDYLPKGAQEPKDVAPKKPEIAKGKAEIEYFNNYSNRFDFRVKVLVDDTQLDIPVFDFPGWVISVDGKQFDHQSNNIYKRISLDLNKGEYLITGRFVNTPIRTVANMITFISVLLLGIIAYRGKIWR